METDLQAASPALETVRLMSLLGSGSDALSVLGMVILFISLLSIFVTLWQNLNRREKDLAVLRSYGASPSHLFFLVILESVIITSLSLILALLVSHLGLPYFASSFGGDWAQQLTGKRWLIEETYVLLTVFFLALLAAIIPAWRASRTDIAKMLV